MRLVKTKNGLKQLVTKEEMREIKQFEKDLKAGKVDFAFTGTFAEGIQFLKDTGEVVDAWTKPL